MMMPGREYQAQPSRFGFNGKENDNEVKGFGNQQDYGERIYDSRLSLWLSLDPLQRKYPGESNYAFVSNNPILYVDQDGKDKIITHIYKDENGKELKKLELVVSDEIRSQRIQVRNRIDKHDYHWEYNWHNVNQTVTHTMSNGVEVSRSVSAETLGEVRTTTDYEFKQYAMFKIKLADKKWPGGISFYSSDGGGTETKKSFNPVQKEDIGMLVSVIDGMKDVGKLDILENSFLQYASKGSTAEKLGEVIDKMERIIQLQAANSKQKEVTGKSPFDKKELPNSPSSSASNDVQIGIQNEPRFKKKVVTLEVDSIRGKYLAPGEEWRIWHFDKKTNDTILKIKPEKKDK
jgi:RHS repeat-associated protein